MWYLVHAWSPPCINYTLTLYDCMHGTMKVFYIIMLVALMFEEYFAHNCTRYSINVHETFVAFFWHWNNWDQNNNVYACAQNTHVTPFLTFKLHTFYTICLKSSMHDSYSSHTACMVMYYNRINTWGFREKNPSLLVESWVWPQLD